MVPRENPQGGGFFFFLHFSDFPSLVIKKRVDFKIREKTANRKTGRFEFGTANDNFSNEKKTAKKKTND